jgi:hypothetical protein
MRRGTFVIAAILLTGTATAARAQSGGDTLSPLAVAVACAPPPSFDDVPSKALRVVGSQDSTPRALFGNRDLLVVSGGSAAGVQLGQEFFIRRQNVSGGRWAQRGAMTLGWLRVVAVNETSAVGLVDHVCNGIVLDDYLEPFVLPDLSAALEKNETPGEPDFGVLGHIVAGSENRDAMGMGDLVLIDWGQDQGLTPGARFAIYRDVGLGGRLPLASIGEGVVVSTGSTMALTRVTRARDVVYSGDYIALRK